MLFPRVVFHTPLIQIHAQRMRSSGQYSEQEIKAAVAEVTVYQELHQDRPGFFDAAINTGLQISSTSLYTVCKNCIRNFKTLEIFPTTY